MDIECIAVINDPVGALISGAHQHSTCRVGLILGTGTNCCYVERLDNVELWEHDRCEPKQVNKVQNCGNIIGVSQIW